MADTPRSLTPSSAFLDATNHAIHERMARAETPPAGAPEDYPGQSHLWAEAARAAEELSGELRDLALDLHAHPELAFEERRSAEALARVVEKRDFAVRRGAHGVETALRAEWVSEGFDPATHPTIAVMSEYDALPGIGHACGHNIIAASGVGAFLAATAALGDANARVVFLGTPAEEGHSGKEYMIRGGMLDGVDAAVMIHPFSFDIASHAWVGRRTLSVTFRGVAAHASAQPFMGRNALDAATLAYQGMGLLRQQMPPRARDPPDGEDRAGRGRPAHRGVCSVGRLRGRDQGPQRRNRGPGPGHHRPGVRPAAAARGARGVRARRGRGACRAGYFVAEPLS